MLLALGPTHGQLNTLESKLIPTIEQIDTAAASYARTAQAVQQLAIETDPAKRNSAFALLAASRSAGEVAWNAYQRLSLNLPGEAKLRRTFEADRKLGLAAGAQLITGSADPVAALALVVQVSDTVLTDLNKIKQLNRTEMQRALRNSYQDIGVAQRDLLLPRGRGAPRTLPRLRFRGPCRGGREIKLDVLNRTLDAESTRNELETRLQRSLEMVHAEEASYALVNRALSKGAPGLAAELLLADSAARTSARSRRRRSSTWADAA